MKNVLKLDQRILIKDDDDADDTWERNPEREGKRMEKSWNPKERKEEEEGLKGEGRTVTWRVALNLAKRLQVFPGTSYYPNHAHFIPFESLAVTFFFLSYSLYSFSPSHPQSPLFILKRYEARSSNHHHRDDRLPLSPKPRFKATFHHGNRRHLSFLPRHLTLLAFSLFSLSSSFSVSWPPITHSFRWFQNVPLSYIYTHGTLCNRFPINPNMPTSH